MHASPAECPGSRSLVCCPYLRVRNAWEQCVADRRDELRWNTNVRRLLVVVRKADELRLSPAPAAEGDSPRQSGGGAGGHGDVGIARSGSCLGRADEVLEVAVEV